ncbi:MAG: NAD(P)/FAD-dependent oxidoreductase [Chloroflexi bacterium]|nr:NAD(P)/FAD-dependent oxidoreductase [Chloroflexota bacterium]
MTATSRYDAIVVGGGHNGLVCAAYLARQGIRTLVLERRDRVGGAVGTHELMPGVRVPSLAHTVGRFRPSIARELGLRGHRLRLVQPDARVFAPCSDGPAVTLWGDPRRTADDLRAISPRDAERYVAFDAQTRALDGVLARIMSMTPPDPGRASVADALGALRIGLGYRALREPDARALLRVLPMPIADHLDDWFESPSLRAALAWRGVRYSSLGPRDAGTTQMFLAESAGTPDGAAGEAVFARGGPGALAEALASAARGFGAEIQIDAQVVTVRVSDDRVRGVALANGDELDAGVVISALDPKRTLLGLIDPAVLGPQLGWQAGNLRLKGSVSKVDLALDELPAFAGPADGGDARRRLRGRIVIAPSVAAIDRAADAIKAGRLAEHPVLEATIPSLVDPSLVDGDSGVKHVMSILVQGTPYHRREGDWETDRDALGERVLAELESVAPGIGAHVLARRVVTPLDLERDHGLTEGHPLHGEPALDQWFAWRPMLGFASYRLPIDGLYLCGAGAHPGGGVTGWPGRNAAREIVRDIKNRARR